MKIAIVNPSMHQIAALKQALAQYQLIWTAQSATEAAAKCLQTLPDVILIDAQLPAATTEQILKLAACSVLITTTDLREHISAVYAAIEQGAIDVVDISGLSDDRAGTTELLAKISRMGKRLTSAHRSSSAYSRTAHKDGLMPLIAIGSSTGGPKALATILAELPTNFRAAIVIVQHVDAHFSVGFADWLSQQTRLPVRIAMAGDRPERGTVLVAGTNDHLYLKSDLTLDYTPYPIEYVYRPSVDVFFKSLAQHWNRQGTAILLTGMGRDGAQGLQALRQQNWQTIAQSQESCVVYGMPKAAVELNAAIEVLSPAAIAATLSTLRFT
ncbi:chemotaxis-specific protein-glutamate methyltransferase CheB [Leptolyngbya sp. FACHB-17]|uniref:chemotaxis-specific protein-glutamate methyltransferase CheB n=1 Tax=unclassified Leptolyngbya TaxID=2650499 RepID=UPI0016804DF8|nr:chemotaxis-specific protein-glutamate methyltransferase CheB [Leptolyngbya sp. FACHB-17]MBD2080975.1 chemotaxis-specific protein-glutamate methyltransferase CheB [Leptolyngbya sp. FACHB-17]